MLCAYYALGTALRVPCLSEPPFWWERQTLGNEEILHVTRDALGENSAGQGSFYTHGTREGQAERYHLADGCMTLGVYLKPQNCTLKKMIGYKTKHTLTPWSSNCTHWYLPKGAKNLGPYKNLPTDVYPSFIHNCQNVGATKMSLCRWVSK